MQCIYKHTWYRIGLKTGGNVTVPVSNHSVMYLKLKFQVTHLYQTIIEIINAKFKLEQLETRTQLINWQVLQMSLFMQNE